MDPTLPLLSCRGLSKRFAGAAGGDAVTACDGVDLDLYPGRIHVVLGENGAGKSTLMSMLCGQLHPDAGEIFLAGKPVALRSPAAAWRAGIGMVHQRFLLAEALTGAENLALAMGGAPDIRSASALAERFGLVCELGKRVAQMSMGERQRLEILKLLARDSRILILDEPTSVLAPVEIDGLCVVLRRLAEQGRAVALITHKLAEIAQLADDASIMRKGRMIARNLSPHPAREGEGVRPVWDLHEISQLMVGCDLSEGTACSVRRPRIDRREVVLRARGLYGPGEPPAFADVNLTLCRGDVLAIVGVAGNGQQALGATLGGMMRPARGQCTVLDRALERKLVAYVPEDRHGMATVPTMSLAENMLLSVAGDTGVRFSRKAAAKAAQAAIDSLNVRASGVHAQARELSGGNLQKFILARELAKGAPLLVVEQPTQGLDVLAICEVHAAIAKAAQSAAVIVLTGDPTEALTLADHVAVIFRGRIVGMVESGTPDAMLCIGRLMVGLAADSSAQPIEGELDATGH